MARYERNMERIDQINELITHLAMAVGLLDQLGASATAAHVDMAIEKLKHEKVMKECWQTLLNKDWSSLDDMVDKIYFEKCSLYVNLPK